MQIAHLSDKRIDGLNTKERFMAESIFIVDDEEHILRTCSRILMDERYDCHMFASPHKALDQARKVKPAVVVSDQRMAEMNGVSLLEKIREELPWTVRIIMTGYADTQSAIAAVNQGRVYRFIKKPWEDLAFRLEIRNALNRFRLNQQLERLTTGGVTQEFIRQERLQGVLEMVAAVCHEFSKPVQEIAGYCTLLRNATAFHPGAGTKTLCDDGREDYITSIRVEAGKISGLLYQIVGIDRYETCSPIASTKMIDIGKASRFTRCNEKGKQ